MVIEVHPVIEWAVRGLCTRPYPGHPKGCPNFNHKEGCPPQGKLYDEVYDLAKPIYAIFNWFDLKAHKERMNVIHPDWSERQISCCLYWQPTARKMLQEQIDEVFGVNDLTGYRVEKCPEAMGINVIKTMQQVGISIVFPPKDWVYQVALAGMPFTKEDHHG